LYPGWPQRVDDGEQHEIEYRLYSETHPVRFLPVDDDRCQEEEEEHTDKYGEDVNLSKSDDDEQRCRNQQWI
jgi:hypothetical protein